MDMGEGRVKRQFFGGYPMYGGYGYRPYGYGYGMGYRPWGYGGWGMRRWGFGK